jgi:dihydrofolate reductase
VRKLILKMSISIDGFVGGENGEQGWMSRSSGDAAAAAWTVNAVKDAGLHIMGSRTFKDMASWWPTSTEIFAPPMNDIQKAVFSRSGNLDESTQAVLKAQREKTAKAESWINAEVIGGDLVVGIERLKKQDGKPIFAYGGASFARSLLATGLIDEYHFLIHPIILGRGLPLYSEIETPINLNLVEARSFPKGAVAHVYRPA